MSFAFFLVFIVYVYDMREISSDGTSRPAAPAQQQPTPTRLMPVLPPAELPPRVSDTPSTAAAPSGIPETAEQR
jgi:hypothetical protein